MGLSIIIPVARNDEEWIKLNQELSLIDIPYECIFVSPIENSFKDKHSRWLVSDIEQRAYQMNLGASVAKYDNIWFLHADSIVSQIIPHLKKILELLNNDSIYYFDLRFYDSCSILTKLNEFGVFFRCKILKLPFGDQGPMMSKKIYHDLGRFDESKLIGEDFYFILSAKRKKIKILSLNKIIFTSARKYNNSGWFKTTYSHLKFTFKEMYK